MVTIANPANFAFNYNTAFTLAAWIYRNTTAEEDDIFGKEDPSNGPAPAKAGVYTVVQ